VLRLCGGDTAERGRAELSLFFFTGGERISRSGENMIGEVGVAPGSLRRVLKDFFSVTVVAIFFLIFAALFHSYWFYMRYFSS